MPEAADPRVIPDGARSTDIAAAAEQWQSRPDARRLVVSLMGKPWVIMPDVLRQLHAIATRGTEGPEAIGIRLGAPLQGTRKTTIRDGVAIIPIVGPIIPRAGMFAEMSGVTSVRSIGLDLEAAVADPDVRSILLEVDSPGGAVTGISDLARTIRAASAQKPVTAFVSGAGASGGYWLASAAERLVIEDTGVVGSIGVVAGIPHQEGPDRDGYRTIEIVSSGAPFKRPDVMADEGRAEIVGYLDAIEALFIDAVADFRGVAPEKVRADFGRGGLKVGAAAVAAGMTDEVSTFEETLREAATRNRTTTTAGVAARPAPEGKTMDLSSLTLETLTASRPDLVSSIQQTAREEGARTVDTSAARTEAAAAERARILGILDLGAAMPAEGSIAAAAIADPNSSVEATAVKIVKASKDAKAAGLAALASDTARVPDASGETGADDDVDDDGEVEEGGEAGEAEARAAWKKDKAARAEFGGDFKSFLAFTQADRKGLVRVGKR